MKRTFIYIVFITITSCEPMGDSSITLPPINLGVIVHPDTSLIHIGDTIILQTNLYYKPDKVNLNDGKVTISGSIGLWETIPISNQDSFYVPKNEEDYIIINDIGNANFNEQQNTLVGYDFVSLEDSLKMSLKFIPLKYGVYHFSIYDGYYIGNADKKANAEGYFLSNPHWSTLWNLTSNPAPLPSSIEYNKSYLVAVTQ